LSGILNSNGTKLSNLADGLKFAGGSHTLFPECKLLEVIELAREVIQKDVYAQGRQGMQRNHDVDLTIT
jgi:hypothetical protein